MKILLTGFDPFGGESINPAYEAVKLLPARIGNADILKQEVPTVYGRDEKVLEAAIEEFQPDVVICVGQAGGRNGITIEKVAINLMEARIPDNDGNQPVDEPIKQDGENAYFTTLPIKAMVKKMCEAGIPTSISYTAGTFVCNDLMYRLLYLIDKKYPSIRMGGFIHVPFLPEQTVSIKGGAPSMSAETIAKSLEIAVSVVVDNLNGNGESVSEAMGETH